MKSVFLLLILALAISAYGQDSLLARFYNKSLQDTTRLKSVYKFSVKRVYTQPDTALYYAEKGIEFCGEKNNLKKLKGNFLNLKGTTLYLLGKYEKALEAYNLSYEIRKKLNDRPGLAVALMNFANVNVAQGNYPLAFTRLMESEKIRVETGDKKGQADCYNNIANLFILQKDLKKSLEYLNKSVVIYQELGEKQGLINAYGNIGSLYSEQDQPDQNIRYQRLSIPLCIEINNELALANAYGNIGQAYKQKNMADSSLFYYTKCEELNTNNGNTQALAATHFNIGELYISRKNYREAIKECETGLTIARETGSPDDIKGNCNCLYEANKALNNAAQALKYFEEYIKTEKELINEEKTRDIALNESRFAYEKKAAADSVLASEERKMAAFTLKQEKTKQYFLYGGIAVAVLFFLILLQRFRTSQQQKKLIQQQKNLVELQKELMEEKQKEILDSIHYAKRIQTALITNEKYIARNLKKLNIK